MKKKLPWIAALLGVAVLAFLVVDDVSTHREFARRAAEFGEFEATRAELKETKAELEQWRQNAEVAMEEMWVRVHVASMDVPKMPDDLPGRLRVLAETMGKGLGRCRTNLAIADAKLGGYYDPHAVPQD